MYFFTLSLVISFSDSWRQGSTGLGIRRYAGGVDQPNPAAPRGAVSLVISSWMCFRTLLGHILVDLFSHSPWSYPLCVGINLRWFLQPHHLYMQINLRRFLQQGSTGLVIRRYAGGVDQPNPAAPRGFFQTLLGHILHVSRLSRLSLVISSWIFSDSPWSYPLCMQINLR